MAPLIERVCSPAVCSFGSKIYVFGGQEGVTMKGYPGMFEDCVLHLPFNMSICELTFHCWFHLYFFTIFHQDELNFKWLKSYLYRYSDESPVPISIAFCSTIQNETILKLRIRFISSRQCMHVFNIEMSHCI